MKKLYMLALVAVMSVAYAVAQPRAIGARLGYGGDFSYEHGVGQNMITLDAGLMGFWGVEAVCTYDWINPFGADFSKVWSKKGEWNWFWGVGLGAGWCWPSAAWSGWGYVGAAMRIGVEYNFWFPLQLSIDWRPVIGPSFSGSGIGFNTGGLYAGAACLGVRYKF